MTFVVLHVFNLSVYSYEAFMVLTNGGCHSSIGKMMNRLHVVVKYNWIVCNRICAKCLVGILSSRRACHVAILDVLYVGQGHALGLHYVLPWAQGMACAYIFL